MGIDFLEEAVLVQGRKIGSSLRAASQSSQFISCVRFVTPKKANGYGDIPSNMTFTEEDYSRQVWRLRWRMVIARAETERGFWSEPRKRYQNIMGRYYKAVGCQPWTIMLTGVSAIACSWLILHSAVITSLVLSVISLWWYIFLYSYPKV
ncbi:hypothetical protein CK203_071529 [Vitis vinifera]|uniref:DUF6737 domain-containing protein n=1 Tax=Vitis vinifera TaxID=29760 RepID=A0A438F4I3_VITVI|nr:hypothetical protein CK203_071529 [Vitis vinifera]